MTEADIVTHAGWAGDFFPHYGDAEWSKRNTHGTLILSVAPQFCSGAS